MLLVFLVPHVVPRFLSLLICQSLCSLHKASAMRILKRSKFTFASSLPIQHIKQPGSFLVAHVILESTTYCNSLPLYIYTNYICYQIFVLSPCAHMDLPSSPLSIRNIIISEIRCSGVEWSSILSFHVCKKNALPMIDNLGTFVWQNRFRGHMSLSCHRNDIAEKNTSRYIHVTIRYIFVCTIRVLLAAQTCNNRTFLYK